jgi:hypothetical protein
VVAALTDSVDPQGYVKDMRRRDPELGKGWGQIATPLSVATPGGAQSLNCANTEGLFRIIQSIPSPKAEPFKRWLAKVGYERIQEIEDPELATKRTRALYQAKGYSDDWIEKRTQSRLQRELPRLDPVGEKSEIAGQTCFTKEARQAINLPVRPERRRRWGAGFQSLEKLKQP